MNNTNYLSDALKHQIKEHLPDFIESKYNRRCKDSRGKFTFFKCIIHEDGKNPNMIIYRDNTGELRAKCHSVQCQKSCDIFDLAKRELNTDDYIQICDYLCDLYNIENENRKKENRMKYQASKGTKGEPFDWDDEIGGKRPTAEPTAEPKKNTESNRSKEESTQKADYREKFKEWHRDLMQFQETNKGLYKKCVRGLSEGTVRKAMLGYNGEHKSLVIPRAIDKYTERAVNVSDKKGRYYQTGSIAPLYDFFDVIHKEKIIFVTEGSIDALSITDVGFNCVALISAEKGDNLINALKGLSDKERAEKDIILNLDNDDAGHDATRKLEEELKKLNMYYDVLFFEKGKDANFYIINGKKSELKELCQKTVSNRKRVREYKENNNAVKKLEIFKRNIENGNIQKPIPTGFKNLDKALEGGLIKGIYSIAAASSLGKTTFALQMAEQIANRAEEESYLEEGTKKTRTVNCGNDVLVFSFEMMADSLIAKSISRLSYIKASDRKKGSLEESELAKQLKEIKRGERYNWKKDKFEEFTADEKKLIEECEKEYLRYAKHIYFFEKTDDFCVDEVEQKLSDHIRCTGNIPVILIDYLQLLDPPKNARNYQDRQTVEENIKALVRLWKKYEVPIILISSMSRDYYNKEVSFSSFKESGLIEFSSDVVIGLQFDVFHKKEVINTGKQNKPDVVGKFSDYERTKFARDIELKILKNREGQTGSKIQYSFVAKYNYFEEGEMIKPEIPKIDPPKSKASKNQKGKAFEFEDVVPIDPDDATDVKSVSIDDL